jgi:rhodanese-related sulfurtransferase
MSFLTRLLGSIESSSSPSPRATPTAVDVQDASRRQSAGAMLIDVREPAEWAQGHAPDAMLISHGSLSKRLADIPGDRDVLLICRSGNRSGSAQRHLMELGYERVFNVTGGMNAWITAGLPISR